MPMALDHVFDDGTVVNALVSAIPLYDARGQSTRRGRCDHGHDAS